MDQINKKHKINPFAKMLNALRKVSNIINQKKSLMNFKKNGCEALKVFDECLSAHGIRYTLAFGTLLGAVREHDFIANDDDIDVAMWIDDYSQNMIDYLLEKGFRVKHSFSVNNDELGKEDSFEYKGVQIDVFYFYKTVDGRVYCCDFINRPGCYSRKESVEKYGGLIPRQLFLPLEDKILRIDFKGIRVSIPANYKQILAFRYGEDYMTPKPGWRPDTKYIISVPEWIGVYKE